MLIKLLLCNDYPHNKHIFIYDWKNVDKMMHTMKNLYSNHVYGTKEATDEIRKY
jgi:hypothetical protein